MSGAIWSCLGGNFVAGAGFEPAAPQSRDYERENWLRGRDLNPRPSGYEPDELPGCSTPRLEVTMSVLCAKANSKCRSFAGLICCISNYHLPLPVEWAKYTPLNW